MRIIGFILLGFVAGILGGPAPDVKRLSEDEYTARALAELRAMTKSRFISDMQTPKCKINKKRTAAKCTLKFKWMQEMRRVTIKISFGKKKVQLKFTLFFDDEEVLQQTLDIAEICAPLPKMLKHIDVCAHAYYINVDTKQPQLSFDSCFVLKIGDIFHLKFNCLKLNKKGKFIQHAKHQPENEAIFIVSVEDGSLKFSVNSPIPPEIIEKIKEGIKDLETRALTAVNAAGEEIDKFGTKLEETWDDIGEELENVGDKIEETLKETGDKIEEKMKQAGGKIRLAGSKIEEKFKQAGGEIDEMVDKIVDTWHNTGDEFDEFVDALDSKWEKAKKQVSTRVQSKLKETGNKIKNMGKGVQESVKNAKDKVKNSVKNLSNKVNNFFGRILH